MAITKVEAGARVPPHAALLEEIARRRSTAAVSFAGIGPVLDVLAAYVAATEARISELERLK